MTVLDQIGSVTYDGGSDTTEKATAFSTNPASGASVFVVLQLYQSGGVVPDGTTITDNGAGGGNAYTEVPDSLADVDGNVIVWYECADPTMPDSGELEITVTLPSAGFYPTPQAFSALGSVDAVATTGTGPSVSVTSTVDGDLFLGGFCADNSSGTGWPWTFNWTSEDSPTNSAYLQAAALTTYPDAGEQTLSVSGVTVNDLAMSALAIKPSGGGGGGSGDILDLGTITLTEDGSVYGAWVPTEGWNSLVLVIEFSGSAAVYIAESMDDEGATILWVEALTQDPDSSYGNRYKVIDQPGTAYAAILVDGDTGASVTYSLRGIKSAAAS